MTPHPRGITMSVKPLLQAIWLADAVSKDPYGKVTVVGMFDQIEVRSGKDYTEGACLFFALRGVHGHVQLQLTYTSLADNETLLERKLTVEGADDPLLTADVTLNINRIPV